MKQYKHTRGKSTHLQEISASQNFLTSRRLLERIVGISKIGKKDIVIEIGTGKGHLTEVLCRRAKVVYTIEIDKNLCERARIRLQKVDNVKIICGDFLKYSLPQKGEYKVFANIPYYITTDIVKKLTEDAHPPSEMWLVMEKGAAKRFMGIPIETKLSQALKRKWRMEIVYYFSKDDFHPKPSVDSVLLHFCFSTHS
uniref:rRNA adenine N(6)-methyltransferase family protein n=1 Tax=Acetatifactor sp. TaxID=1872090 RepID=UPI00405646A2